MRRSGRSRSDDKIRRSWAGCTSTMRKDLRACIINGPGAPPLFTRSQQDEIVNVVRKSDPVTQGLPGHGWTLKKLCRWVESTLGRCTSRNTLRRILKAAGLSWKKCKKLLSKANPEKRTAFVEQFQLLFEQMCRDEVCILYVDEAHFHQDLDLGHTWADDGKPLWRESISPPGPGAHQRVRRLRLQQGSSFHLAQRQVQQRAYSSVSATAAGLA